MVRNHEFASRISPVSIKRESNVEMLISPNSFTLIARTTAGSLAPTIGSRARIQLAKKRAKELLRRQISAGARCQPYLRK